jgi:hypothetical protein
MRFTDIPGLPEVTARKAAAILKTFYETAQEDGRLDTVARIGALAIILRDELTKLGTNPQEMFNTLLEAIERGDFSLDRLPEDVKQSYVLMLSQPSAIN